MRTMRNRPVSNLTPSPMSGRHRMTCGASRTSVTAAPPRFRRCRSVLTHDWARGGALVILGRVDEFAETRILSHAAGGVT
jgi:hypothetical protein